MMMSRIDRKLFDPAVRDKSDDWLELRTSLWGWIMGSFPRHEFLKWHGDLRI